MAMTLFFEQYHHHNVEILFRFLGCSDRSGVFHKVKRTLPSEKACSGSTKET